MKTEIFVITGAILLIGIFAITPVYASFTDSILIQVSGDFRKMYYNEKHITSVLFDPNSASVIFETGGDTVLEIKAPKVYKTGSNLFILKNGEEIEPESKTEDDCFYYVTIETKNSEQIEVAYTFWPEYPETIKPCETIDVSPLKQVKYGIAPWDVKCDDGLTLLLKPTEHASPACVTGDTAKKLIERNWSISVSRGK